MTFPEASRISAFRASHFRGQIQPFTSLPPSNAWTWNGSTCFKIRTDSSAPSQLGPMRRGDSLRMMSIMVSSAVAVGIGILGVQFGVPQVVFPPVRAFELFGEGGFKTISGFLQRAAARGIAGIEPRL